MRAVTHQAKSTLPCVLLAGGGTGGHLFPGVAVAQEWRRRYPDAPVVFAGTKRGLEARVVPREGFGLEQIRSAGLVGRSRLETLRSLALVPLSFWDAWKVLHRRRPGLVIGLGGYSSGPFVLLAAATGLPTIVLEQNAVPGLTNRLVARVTRAAAVSYEATLPYFGEKGFLSGNPVRAVFFDVAPPTPTPATVHVLVLGGSQGAHAINIAMTAGAATLAASPRPILVTHQTGSADLDSVRAGYRAAGITARVEVFLDAVEEDMASADLVVCRFGATTLAEVAAAGRAAVVVPFPHAAHDHQRRNAAVLAEAGAGEVIEQPGLNARLATRVVALASDDARRIAMGDASRRLARPGAARAIVDRAEQLLGLRDEMRAVTGVL